MPRFAPPYRIVFNPATRMFDVYLDGKVVGSHVGRSGAEKIGRNAVAVEAVRQAYPTATAS